MPARIHSTEDRLEVFLSGELDHHNTRKIREDIDSSAQCNQPKELVLDFGGVEFMDSSGIGLVLGRYRLMQDLGGTLRLQNVPGHIKKVMRVAGIDNLCISGKKEKGDKVNEN